MTETARRRAGRPPSSTTLPSSERLGFAAVAAGLATVTLTGARPLPGVTISDALLACGAVLLLAARVRGGSHPIPRPWWLLAAAAGLALSGLVVELFPPDPPSRILTERKVSYFEIFDQGSTSNVSHLLRFVGALLLTPIVVALAATSRRRLGLLVDLWLASIAVNCLVAALDYLGAGLGPFLTGNDYRAVVPGMPDRYAGLTVNPTHLSLACAMGMPVAVVGLRAAAGRRRAAHWALIALLVLGILLSGSRAGLVGALLGAVLVLAFDPRTRRVAVAVTGLSAALVPLAALSGIGLLSGAERLVGGGTAGASDSRRTLGFEQAFADIEARPWAGYGFELVRSAHNVVLQLLQAGGPIALAAFTAFVVGTLATTRSIGRHGATAASRRLAWGLGVATGVWLLTAMVETSIFDRFLYVPAGLVLGLALLERRHSAAPAPAVVTGD